MDLLQCFPGNFFHFGAKAYEGRSGNGYQFLEPLLVKAMVAWDKKSVSRAIAF